MGSQQPLRISPAQPAHTEEAPHNPWSKLPKTASTQEDLCSPGAPGQTLSSHGKCSSTTAHACQSCLPSGSAPLPGSEPGRPACPLEVLHFCGACWPALPDLRKSSEAQEHKGKPCLATGSAPPLRCTPASHTHPWEVLLCLRVTLLAPPTLGKHPLPRSGSDMASLAHTWEKPCCFKEGQKTTPSLRNPSPAASVQTMQGHRECTFSTKKKNTNKMKKLRNHSQLKQPENSPKAVNSETDLCSLIDLEFKRETVKILKELREYMNSNTDSLRKELGNMRRSQENI